MTVPVPLASSPPGPVAAAARAVPVRPAATLVLARDGVHRHRPLEVLLLRRRPDSGFVPGAHVFPGGAVDPDDRSLPVPEGADLTAATAARALGLGDPDVALAHWAAALRETFEECGALLAHRPGAGLVDVAADADLGDRLAYHRHQVDRGQRRFADVLVQEGLVPALDHLRYLGRWVTPLGAPRRYDTRFFVAPAPHGQDLSPDGREVTELAWVRPAHALDLQRAGRMELVLPTQRTLELLTRFATAEALLAALPRWPDGHHVAEDGGGWRVPLGGEPGGPALVPPGSRS